MASPDLSAMKTSPKFIFFTDFDGTITLKDSNDWLTDNLGYGEEKRKEENLNTLTGKNKFRDSFQGMMESVTTPYNKCIELLVQNIKLDPGFKQFFLWSIEQNIPVVVLSSGMEPIIRAILRNLVGPESDRIQIVSNHVKTKPGKTLDDENGWDLVFHDDRYVALLKVEEPMVTSGSFDFHDFGHDKSLTLRPYAQLPADQRPVMFYAGDGVSDLSAARESDLLFAKEGKDLVTYCVRENVPFTTFADWTSIQQDVEKIAAGKISVQDAAKEGYESFKKSLN